MPPSRKQSVVAGRSARLPDSSDEEAAEAEVKQRQRERQPKALFSKQAIYQAVLGSGAQTVRGNVPTLVAPDSVQRDWAAWLEETPERLEEVPAIARPLPLAMPMKCVPAGTSSVAPLTLAGQVELITYQNPGGAGISKKGRDYEARQTRALLQGMTDVDDVVAVTRPDEHEADRAGFRTPFYLGKVLRVHFAEGGGSSSDTKRVIEALDLHWYYPFFNAKPCDDVTRPWKLACQGLLHEWRPRCETYSGCCAARRPELGNTSREWARVEADTIIEVGVAMTPVNWALAKAAKEKLAAGNTAWAEALKVKK